MIEKEQEKFWQSEKALENDFRTLEDIILSNL